MAYMSGMYRAHFSAGLIDAPLCTEQDLFHGLPVWWDLFSIEIDGKFWQCAGEHLWNNWSCIITGVSSCNENGQHKMIADSYLINCLFLALKECVTVSFIKQHSWSSWPWLQTFKPARYSTEKKALMCIHENASCFCCYKLSCPHVLLSK